MMQLKGSTLPLIKFNQNDSNLIKFNQNDSNLIKFNQISHKFMAFVVF